MQHYKLVKDLSGIGNWRIKHLCAMVNQTLSMAGGKFKKFKCNPHTLTPFHLLVVGVARCKMRVPKELPRTAPNVLKEVEIALRRSKVTDDASVVECLAAAVGINPVQYAELYFPTCPHEPVSFLPRQLKKSECEKLKKLLPDARTLTELKAAYIYAHDREELLRQINECVEVAIPEGVLLDGR